MIKSYYPKSFIRTDDSRFDSGENESMALAIELLTNVIADIEPGKIVRLMLDMEVRRPVEDDSVTEIHWLQFHAAERFVWQVEPWWKTVIRKVFKIA